MSVTEWYARSAGGTFPYFPYDRLAIYDGRFKYAREGDGGDLVASPFETEDVRSSHPDVAVRLSAALEAGLRAPAGAGGAKTGGDIDEQLRALGYVE